MEIIVSRRSSNFPFTLIVVEVSDVVGERNNSFRFVFVQLMIDKTKTTGKKEAATMDPLGGGYRRGRGAKLVLLERVQGR